MRRGRETTAETEVAQAAGSSYAGGPSKPAIETGQFASCVDLSDLRRRAKARAHPMVFDYIDGGSGDERALRNSVSAFAQWDIIHRVLRGVDSIDTSVTYLGEQLPLPFFPSPAAGNRLFHTDGERAVARSASLFGTPYCLSTLSSVSIEEIASITSGPKWFQLYVWKDRGLVREMLERARDAGFSALILTVDFPITGQRKRDIRNGFTIPPSMNIKTIIDALLHPFWTLDYLKGPAIKYANLSAETPATSLASFVGEQLSADFDWKDAEWLLGEWRGKAVIKGVVDAEDARRAVAVGFDGITVSNHGGRQLDASPAPIDALPYVVDAVQGDADVVLDGGVRSGEDIIRALALGATCVSFARPYLYGLAAGGHLGVNRAFEILSESFKREMALAGIPSTSLIDRSLVRRTANLA